MLVFNEQNSIWFTNQIWIYKRPENTEKSVCQEEKFNRKGRSYSLSSLNKHINLVTFCTEQQIKRQRKNSAASAKQELSIPWSFLNWWIYLKHRTMTTRTNKPNFLAWRQFLLMITKAIAFLPSLNSFWEVKKKNMFSCADERIVQHTELFFLGGGGRGD